MDINECYLQLIENQVEIMEIQHEISIENNRHENCIKKLNEKVNERKKEIQELRNILIPIKLGDLIDELGWLSETKIDKIHVVLETNVFMNGVHELSELVELVNIRNVRRVPFCMRLRLWNNDMESVSFDYFMFLPFYLNNIPIWSKQYEKDLL